MLKHAVCHLLMDWMFQRLSYKHTAVKIDKHLLASPFRPLTSHHIPIRHPECIPNEYYMKNMYWILISKNYRIKQLIITSIEIENNTKEKQHTAYLRQR